MLYSSQDLERVIIILRSEGCPEEILSPVIEWVNNNKKMITSSDLMCWMEGVSK